ncbi:hypothetical protein ACWKSP_05110 [Micromonosporaceae bacterium Da 78-11]
MADVSFDLASAPGEPVLLLVMLQGPEWVLSFRAVPEAIDTLRWIREAGRAGHPALRVGEAVSSPVHWAADGETATIMVGESAEAWDFAVTIPLADVDLIVNGAAGYRAHLPQTFAPQPYSPQSYPPQSYPQQAYAPQAYPPQAYPSQACPSQPYQQPQQYPGSQPPQP